MNSVYLFVYGTLRAGFDGNMARWLRSVATLTGSARAAGRLYRVADYPGFVPGAEGHVAGDLFTLADPAGAFAILDAHEECTPAFPEPWEYRRVRISVDTPDGPAEAWTYVYARDVAGLDPIEGGDFLA
jgi:gamma-glutamylcyclotransferase (GGCT)/AIG2-like uncharacterized protein YtfP